MRSNTETDPVTARLEATQTAVSDLVTTVLDGQLRWLGHDELSSLLAAVRSVQARLEFVALTAIREVDTRRSYVDDGALSAGAWARMHTRMTPTEAAGAVRTARVLGSGELPGTAAALAAGQIDLGHVRAITTAVAGAPAGAAALIEDEALAVAREADPRAVAAVMARFTHALDPDAADKAALARYERRGITLSPLPDGMVHIRGLADEVTGALLMSAISAANPPVTGDTRTAAQARIDAVVDICRHYLGSPDAPMAGGGHAHLIVTLDSDDLTPPSHDSGTNSATGDETTSTAGAGAGPGGTLCWVGPVTASTARRVGCDADVTFVSIDDQGAAQVVGRETRFFTWAQRKAMIARDGDRCCVPYCDRPISWADAHHLKDWTLGGPTTIDNGGLPCSAHHTLLHEGHWTLHRQPDGRYQLQHPTGRVIGPEPHPPGHNRPPPHPRH